MVLTYMLVAVLHQQRLNLHSTLSGADYSVASNNVYLFSHFD